MFVECFIGFVWGDVWLVNMIFVGDCVCVVIDWEIVLFGGVEFDLGWWLFFDWYVLVG